MSSFSIPMPRGYEVLVLVVEMVVALLARAAPALWPSRRASAAGRP